MEPKSLKAEAATIVAPVTVAPIKTKAEFVARAAERAAANLPMVPLDATDPEDREAMLVWLAFTQSRGVTFTAGELIKALKGKGGPVTYVQTRLPSQMTGLPIDDTAKAPDPAKTKSRPMSDEQQGQWQVMRQALS